MKTDKPKILFYCQHSLGMGHLVRSLALAENLANEFDVTLLNGGRFSKKMRFPENVEIVNLPPLAFDENKQLVSCDKRRSVARAKNLRRAILRAKYAELKPEIVLTELFPFGRKKFADEILYLLRQAKGKAKIVCSLRDILVGSRRDQERFEEKAIRTANEFFDAVLIHSDEKFVKFEDSLKTKSGLKIPKFYTGFVVPNAKIEKGENRQSNKKKIIVSAGGGIVGENLLRVAIEAHKTLSKTENIETKIVTGLFLPKDIFQKLQAETRRIKKLKLVRFEKKLRGAMAESDVSVSQCGYNTAFDILLSGVAGIVVPFDENGEDEQLIRARKLEDLGALKVLKSKNLTAENLASEIKKSFAFQPKKISLDVRGGQNSAKILKSLLPDSRQAKNRGEKFWLQSVRDQLGASDCEVGIFFRDDDAGICDEKLFRLLDIFEKYKIPLDLAVIPKMLTKHFSAELKARIKSSENLLAIHQHGFSHLNHELEGRKCEFGASRPRSRQFADIFEGRMILEKHFGKIPKPIFTPPWNRCSTETAAVLRELDFVVLSRESGTEFLNVERLLEIPVSIDWFAKRKGVFLEKEKIGEMIAEKIREKEAFGIMLHHAEMDDTEFGELENLCNLLSQTKRVKFVSMMDLTPEPDATFRH